jgi:hypothetical protein
MEIEKQDSVVNYLNGQLKLRKKVKPGYGTKHLAKDLEIDHSRLLKIMKVDTTSGNEADRVIAKDDCEHLNTMGDWPFIG